MKKKRIRRIIAVFILLPIAAVIGGSFYMLAFSLRPDAKMREKNATAYEYMYAEYPFLRPWVDSLQTAGALRDTVIADPGVSGCMPSMRRLPCRPTARRLSSTVIRTAPCGC